MDEKSLIKYCKRNDREAQKALYNQYAPAMLGICYRYTKSLDDAEDVLQEGFVKVFRQIGQYRGEGSLGAWIRKIMVHSSLSYLRSHNRYRNQMVFDVQPLHQVVNEEATSHLQAADLMELLRKLPVGYQTIFNLVAIEGYSHSEVAELLDISVQTSRSQYSRARAQLIKWLQDGEKEQYAG